MENMSDAKVFVSYLATCISNLVKVVEKYKFEPEVINEAKQAELDWNEYLQDFNSYDSDAQLNELMSRTCKLYKKVGKQLVEKVKSDELKINDELMCFKYEYTLTVNSIENYFKY